MSRRAWALLQKPLVWAWVEQCLVQILVVVANIQMRTLKAEVEKGSMWTAIGHGLVGPKTWGKSLLSAPSWLRSRKGIRLIFLKLDVDVVWQHKWARRRQREPLEELSFLFNSLATLKLDYPEIRLYVWKSTLLFEVSGVLLMVLENPREIISHQVVPITASGLQG